MYSPPCPWDTHYQFSIKTLSNTKYQNKNQPFSSVLSAPILFLPANIPPASHLKHPLFQSLDRFTGTGFVRTKRNHFFFPWGVLTTLIKPQSTQGCGHLSGSGSQRLGTGLLQPGQSWQGCKGDSRDTSTFVTSCPVIAPSRGIESPVPTGVHTLAWTAAG